MESHTAVRRLQQDLKQLQSNPIVGCNAIPLDKDIKTWYANVMGPEDTPYAGVCVRFVMEFPTTYPIDPPKAFFISDIRYLSGASSRDASGRLSVCLDLFGNFRDVHSEWKNDGVASGWAPSYTVSSILVSMQSMMMGGFLSTNPADIERARKSSQEIRCKDTGHDGSNPSKYVPTVPSAEFVLDFEEKKRAVDKEQNKEFTTADGLNTKNHFICYATQQTLPDVVLGYGVTIASNQITSPCEYLSLAAYQSGVRNGTRNQRFDYWIPLYINEPHFEQARSHLITNCQVLYKALSQTSKTLRPDAPVPLQILEVLSSAMNNMVVEVMNNKNNLTANDKFIDGYFAFFRLLTEAARKNPKLGEHVDKEITAFLQGPEARIKSVVPNLGNWLIRLLISGKYGWNNVAASFIQECDARNVLWYAKGNKSNPPKFPDLIQVKANQNRAKKVFQATETSRNLVCFQVKFLQMTKEMTVEKLDANYGIPTEAVRAVLKNAYVSIMAMKDWEDYFRWLKMPLPSNREADLVAALELSRKNRYH